MPVDAENPAPEAAKPVAAPAQAADGAGCNCNNFTEYFPHFTKQLLACVSDHGADEKVGLMWWSAPDKGCGAFPPAHHAFLSWLTLVVWAQAAVSLVYFIMGVIIRPDFCQSIGSRELCVSMDAVISAGNVIMQILIQCIWCFMWSYVGYWSMETRNKNWSIAYLILHALWTVSVLMNTIQTTDLWDYSGLFLALTIAYAVLLAAVAHTLVFGIVVWQKINHPTAAKKQAPAPGAQA